MNDSKKAVIMVVSALVLLGLVISFKRMFPLKEKSAGTQSVSAPSGEVWPVFRGDKQFTGYVKSIPGKPQVAWRFRAKASVNAGPVASDNRLFFGDSEGTFYCLDLNTGKPVWQKKVSDGFSAPALLVSGICYIGSQSGDFFALSMTDGKIIWQYKSPEQISGSANFFKHNDQLRIVFGCYDFKLRCLDIITGKELWNVPTGNYINGAPAVDNSKIVFGGCDGYLRIVDGISGKEQLKLKLKSYIPASPAIYDSIIYVATYDHKIFAVNQKGEILWSFDSGNDAAPFLSSPAVNRDVVAIGDRDGVVHILNRADGKLLVEFQTSGDVVIGPVISDKRGVIADKDGFIYIFDLTTGKEKWRYQIGPEIAASLAICGNKIIVADDDGNITVFNGTKELSSCLKL
jgi:outer membrane protein assembly factor BamB